MSVYPEVEYLSYQNYKPLLETGYLPFDNYP